MSAALKGNAAASTTTADTREPSILDQILDQVQTISHQQSRPSPVRLKTWEDIERFAVKAAKSGMVPQAYKGIPDAIVIAVILGAELGLAPMQSLQNIAVVSGRPTVFGDAMPALCRASGKVRHIKEWSDGTGDNLTCYCEALRKDDPNPILGKFGVADAKKAGLWGKQGPWTQYPTRMLQMRARGFCLRDAFPDVLKGLISAEEAADIPPFEDTGLRMAAPTPEQPTSTTEPDPGPKPLTRLEVLLQIERDFAAARTADEVNAILARSDVQKAQDVFRNGHADRLTHAINTAIARTNEPPIENDEHHEDEGDDSLFAPGQDPFAEAPPPA